MGKRRRKLLRRKYASLPWNVYNKLHPKDNSEAIEELKETKEVIETPKVSFEKKEEVFSVPVSLNEINDPESLLNTTIKEVFEIVEEKATAMVENFIEEKPEIPSDKELRGMRKSQLLSIAKELQIDNIRANNTKRQILQAIQATR